MGNDPVVTLSKFIQERSPSQTAFALKAGIDRSVLCHLLNRTRHAPGLATALKIEIATGGAVPAGAWVARAAKRKKSA